MKEYVRCKYLKDNIEYFTEDAVWSLIDAEEICSELGDGAVNTGHILWGLAGKEGGLASDLMYSYDINRAKIYEALKKTYKRPGLSKEEDDKYGFPEEPDETGELDYTFGAKKVLSESISNAVKRTAGDKKAIVGTIQILFQLICLDSYALHLIGEMGADDNAFTAELSQLINSNEIMKRKMAFPMNGIELPDGNEQQAAEEMLRELAARNQEEGQKGQQEGPSVQMASTPLDYFGTDMIKEASDGLFNPVVGRDDIMNRIIRILFRKTKNSPCLIGESGVGKTAVVEGLASRIADGNVPESAANMRIVRIDVPSLIAGARFRGDFEERIQMVIDEASSDKNTVLFIDDIHLLAGNGAEGAGDASGLLKTALSRGDIRIIGATTTAEYRRLFERNGALSRRFQEVQVPEPDAMLAVKMLDALIGGYESYHNVIFEKGVTEAAVRLSARYIPDRFLPDKAVDLIDEAATTVIIDAVPAADSERQFVKNKIKEIYRRKIEAIKAGDVKGAALLNEEENRLRNARSGPEAGRKNGTGESKKTVGISDIEKIVSQWSGVPLEKVGKEDSEKLLELESAIHKRLVGQDEAVTLVSKAVRRGRAGMKDPKRPIGSFIFLGPTGVGKTELARALAENLFGDEKNMIRLDMSEYMEAHSVSKMIGSPPGYVGFEDGGQLTERVRTRPYSVILFDEIEKAHPDVFNILLQVLEDGTLTDSKGRTADFRNTVIIMTSNIGARDITERRFLGFSNDTAENQYETMADAVKNELKRVFKPEFLNRIDETVIFRPLTKEQTEDIARLQLETVRKRGEESGVTIEFLPEVAEYLGRKGFDPKFGARPLKRLIRREIEDVLSEEILKRSLPSEKKKAGKEKIRTVIGVSEDGQRIEIR